MGWSGGWSGGSKCLDWGWRGRENRRKTWTGAIIGLDRDEFWSGGWTGGVSLPTAKPVAGWGLERASGGKRAKILDGVWIGTADPGSDPNISVQWRALALGAIATTINCPLLLLLLFLVFGCYLQK